MARPKHTPTTDEVREVYALNEFGEFDEPEAFDRWLAAYRAELVSQAKSVQAQADPAFADTGRQTATTLPWALRLPRRDYRGA